MMNATSSPLQSGLFLTTAAYITWGLLPLFYRQLQGIDAFEIFVQRVIWSVPVIWLLLKVTGTQVRIYQLLRDPKSFFWLFLSTACISTSWYLNTWGVTHGQVLLVSLAFFLTPLVSILIGVLYLKERLNARQMLALSLCISGFGYACLSLQEFPWLTLGIAMAFGTYGLIKKQVKIDTLNALGAEVVLVLPVAIFFLIGLGPDSRFVQEAWDIRVLLMLTAPLALLPLGLFSFGVARLSNLSTVAILQYIEPTLYFLLAVFVFEEAFRSEQMITFALVWLGFIVFSLDSLRQARRARRALQQTTSADELGEPADSAAR